MRATLRFSLLAIASKACKDVCCLSNSLAIPSWARSASSLRLAITMPSRMSCSFSCSMRRLVSSSARTVGMATAVNEVRSASVNRSWSSIILNWKERNWSGPSPPASQPKRSRNLATLSARRSKKSGKLNSLNAWPVGAVSMIIWSNFSFFISSRTSTSATISSLPGGNVSNKLTKSSIGNCCNTCPTRPPPCSRLANAVRTVSWKRCIAAPVSTSIAHSSPVPMIPSTCVACSPNGMPRASPRECAGSVEMAKMRFPAVA
mmetsp:Transcript_10054/g.19001  ORF Transcript_10054/g.19001 Transcript_10054/m.19001 type:complete len:261 (+) Transcript_10054:241-1023(+)